jgi:GntR family transcriptional regulator, nutrient-sensing system regulator
LRTGSGPKTAPIIQIKIGTVKSVSWAAMRASPTPEPSVAAIPANGAPRPAPKSQRLREALLAMMRELPEGAPLPTERALCADFGVSRATVRHVLHTLESEQRIYRRQGKGTFVACPKIEQRLGLTSHTEEMRASGIRPGSKLIDVRREAAGREIGEALRLGDDGEVLRIERLRLADDDPIAIEVLFLDARRFDGVSSALGDGVSFYQLLSSSYGVELASAEETIEAIVAGQREAKLLGCGTGAALLQLSRLTHDTHDAPVEYVRSVYRADRFRFRQRLERRPAVASAGPLLRGASPGDAAALAAVFVAAWRDAYPGVVDDAILAALDVRDVTDWLGNLVVSSNQVTVLAEDPPGSVAGFVRFGADPGDARLGHVYALYTHPRAARRGIGRRLLDHALAELAPDGRRPVSLWVFEQNERARRLYAAAGFVPDGARRVEPQYGAQEIRLLRAGGGADGA